MKNTYHNPDNLTPEQVDPHKEGWRLMIVGEPYPKDGQYWYQQSWVTLSLETTPPVHKNWLHTRRTKAPLPEPDYTSKEHKLEVFKAWLDGKKVEWEIDPNKWDEWGGRFFPADEILRIKPEPTQHEIDYKEWQEFEKDRSCELNESNFVIWEAALLHERAKK